MPPLIITFLRPPICVPFILAQVIPIPEASIPDSVIVTHDTDDYFEVFVMQQSGSSLDVMSGSPITYFMGYKLIE